MSQCVQMHVTLVLEKININAGPQRSHTNRFMSTLPMIAEDFSHKILKSIKSN